MEQPSVLNEPRYAYLVEKQSIFIRAWKKLFSSYCKFVFFWYTPVTVHDRGKIPNTSYIMSCNHNSHMDVALLMAASGKGMNHFGMLAAKDYWFDNPNKKFFTKIIMNLIPISRKNDTAPKFSLEETLALCKAFMKRGNRCLIMFPEGTRGVPGVLGRFKIGTATFASNLGVPIVPAYIDGSSKAWPRGKIFMRPAKINIHLCDPIYPEDFGKSNGTFDFNEKGYKEFVNQISQELEKRIRNVKEELYDR